MKRDPIIDNFKLGAYEWFKKKVIYRFENLVYNDKFYDYIDHVCIVYGYWEKLSNGFKPRFVYNLIINSLELQQGLFSRHHEEVIF